MQKDKFSRIISFLLGASSAIVFFGALITFRSFLSLGLPIAIFLTFGYIFVTLFMILALDSFSTNKQKLQEMKKQTKLLEELFQEKDEKIIDA